MASLSLGFLRVEGIVLLPSTMTANGVVQYLLIHNPEYLDDILYSDQTLACLCAGAMVSITSLEIMVTYLVGLALDTDNKGRYPFMYYKLRNQDTFDVHSFFWVIILAHWLIAFVSLTFIRWTNQCKAKNYAQKLIQSNHLIKVEVFVIQSFVILCLAVVQSTLGYPHRFRDLGAYFWPIFPLLCVCFNDRCRAYTWRKTCKMAFVRYLLNVKKSIYDIVCRLWFRNAVAPHDCIV